MKIAYVSVDDCEDIHAWSGLVHHIFQALKNSGHETIPIDNLKGGGKYSFLGLKKFFYKLILKKVFIRDRDPFLLKSYARQVEKRLKNQKFDLIFLPTTLPIAYIQTNLPIVFWCDATFYGMINYYPSFSNLCNETLSDGHLAEKLAISRCSLAIYSSDWAASAALDIYGANTSKVKVVPFGGNLFCSRTISEIEEIVNAKTFEVCNLLFIGVEWSRKGGDIALNVVKKLNEKGITAVLNIVGCTPPIDQLTFCKCHGFLSKKSPSDMDHLEKLMKAAHFLIVPSRAEAFGLVFAEASSYGLPSISINTGGIPSVITSGRNGMLFNEGDGIEKYCEYIIEKMSNKNNYRELAISSFMIYKESLNWDAAMKTVNSHIKFLFENK